MGSSIEKLVNKVASPDARSPLQLADALTIPDTNPVRWLIPITQWSSIRIRGQITGAAGTLNAEFVRPRANPSASDPLLPTVYGADQPSIDGTAWVDGTEFSLEITATEHQGEGWLLVSLTAAGACEADFLDVSGVLVGNYH